MNCDKLGHCCKVCKSPQATKKYVQCLHMWHKHLFPSGYTFYEQSLCETCWHQIMVIWMARFNMRAKTAKNSMTYKNALLHSSLSASCEKCPVCLNLVGVDQSGLRTIWLKKPVDPLPNLFDGFETKLYDGKWCPEEEPKDLGEMLMIRVCKQCRGSFARDCELQFIDPNYYPRDWEETE